MEIVETAIADSFSLDGLLEVMMAVGRCIPPDEQRLRAALKRLSGQASHFVIAKPGVLPLPYWSRRLAELDNRSALLCDGTKRNAGFRSLGLPSA